MFCFAAPASVLGQAANFSVAADSLKKLVASGFVPSVAFSVVNRSGTLYEGAFGYADREHGLKATARTAYPVASVAKSYTAIGALRAVDAKRIELDAPANKYLGADSIDVPVGDGRRLTVRALLHMTAGIPHVVRFHWPDEPRDRSWDTRVGHFAAFPPGAQFHYSNESLGLVGDILARVSRKPFSTYMRDEVFQPLGMVSSAVRSGDLPANRVALAYRDKPSVPSGFTRLDPEGGAGMYTSAHDMTTLARRVILNPDNTFLSARVRENLTDFSQYPYYSTGWWSDPFRLNGLTLVADGAAYGHSASMKVLPAEGLAVAITVNGPVPDGFTMELCNLLLRAARNGQGIPSKQEIPPEYVDRPVTSDTAWRGNWTGYIRTAAANVPIKLVFDSVGMSAALRDEPLQRAKASLSSAILESRIRGELPRSVVAGLQHELGIELRNNGDGASGYVTARTRLGDRPFLVLPFFVSLKRVPDRTVEFPLARAARTTRLAFGSATPARGSLDTQVAAQFNELRKRFPNTSIVKIRAFAAAENLRDVEGALRRLASNVNSRLLPVVSSVGVAGFPDTSQRVQLEVVVQATHSDSAAGIGFLAGVASPTGERTIAGLARVALESGVPAEDVQRVSCFYESATQVEPARAAVATTFGNAALTLVQSRRAQTNPVIECEAVARLRRTDSADVRYFNSPGRAPSPNYSHASFVSTPRLVFTSGILAGGTQSAMDSAFAALQSALAEQGARLSDVVMGNNYWLNDSARDQLRAARVRFYQGTIPAATGVTFTGLAAAGAVASAEVVVAADRRPV